MFRDGCATSPLAIPPLGWKDILWRTYREVGRNRLTALSGGITFYILLATFPAIASFVSLYSLFSDIGTVERQLSHLSTLLPSDAVNLITSQAPLSDNFKDVASFIPEGRSVTVKQLTQNVPFFAS